MCRGEVGTWTSKPCMCCRHASSVSSRVMGRKDMSAGRFGEMLQGVRSPRSPALDPLYIHTKQISYDWTEVKVERLEKHLRIREK